MPTVRWVVWSPAAERDLLDIWAYYVRAASPDIADNLLRQIAETAADIPENPLLSRDRAELMDGLRSIMARPHVIFFELRNDSVEIARVLHGRRDFPAIFAKDDE